MTTLHPTNEDGEPIIAALFCTTPGCGATSWIHHAQRSGRSVYHCPNGHLDVLNPPPTAFV